MVLFHAPDLPLKAPRHIHEHKCANRWRNVNIASIKRQNVVVMEKLRHHQMMQGLITQTRMNYPNANFNLNCSLTLTSFEYEKVMEPGF
jgi:hypothetical protein